MIRYLVTFLLVTVAAGCGQVWNDPYPAAERGQNILYSAFTQRPKHLDPVQSYSEDEATFLYQIYEPPLQYHYLKRPYQLAPATARAMPVLRQYDEAGQLLAAGVDPARVARSEYEIQIQPGIRYQPHPAFATDSAGKPVYLDLSADALAGKRSLGDFPLTGTRELTAEDYVYQIKRLAHPRLHSPVLELMGDYIIGLKDLHALLVAGEKASKEKQAWIDLRSYPMSGVEVVDRYTYKVRIKGAYPQFPYWLAMPFFAPVPFEADRFFSQPGMAERNLTLDWWPIGTGPYMLQENNPNARMVLVKNPNYHGESYPCEGEDEDKAGALLADCGKPLPFIDKVVFTREKESIPYWNKFLQGYYDASGVSSDNFDQAVQMGGQGDVSLSDEMVAKGRTASSTSCVTITTVAWVLATISSNSSCSLARVSASRAPKGSSISSTLGSMARARAMPTRCFMPPEISPGRFWAAGVRPTRARAASVRAMSWALFSDGAPVERLAAPKTRSTPRYTFSKQVSQGKSEWFWNTTARSGPGPAISRLAHNRWPWVGRVSPAIRFSNVDLPQPECPIKATNSPLATVRLMSLRAQNGPFLVLKTCSTPLMSMNLVVWFSFMTSPLQK